MDKRRKQNFSEDELFVLIMEVANRKRLLLGKLDNEVTRQLKKRGWKEVTDAVNAVSKTHRYHDEIRKKFSDYRSAVKKKLGQRNIEMKKTVGGGPDTVPDLTPAEDAMRGLITDIAVAGLDIPDSEASFDPAALLEDVTEMVVDPLDVELPDDFDDSILSPLTEHGYSLPNITAGQSSGPGRIIRTTTTKNTESIPSTSHTFVPVEYKRQRRLDSGEITPISRPASSADFNISRPSSTDSLEIRRLTNIDYLDCSQPVASPPLPQEAKERYVLAAKRKAAKKVEPVAPDMLEIQKEIRDYVQNTSVALQQLAEEGPRITDALDKIAGCLADYFHKK